MAIEKIYDFEFSEVEYPVQLDINLSSAPGFELRDTGGTLLEKNESGNYTLNDVPSIYINENVEGRDEPYFFDASLVIAYGDQNVFRSDGDSSKGHTFGNDNGLLVPMIVGPFKIVNDSFDMVATLVGDLEVSFLGIDLCVGDCNKANNFVMYDKDGFNYIQNAFKMSRITPQGVGLDEVIWRYTGFTQTFEEGRCYASCRPSFGFFYGYKW